MTLYAYIMTNDDGRAPNPSHGVCTLAYCMEMTRGVAEKHDYVVGLAGAEFKDSRWNVIYAMKVAKWLSPDEYCKRFRARRPQNKKEQKTLDKSGALVSNDYVYWGREAPCLPHSLNFLIGAFFNGNGTLCPRGHKNRFTSTEVQKFERWFNEQKKQKNGKRGEPFGTAADEDKQPRTSHRRSRKKC